MQARHSRQGQACHLTRVREVSSQAGARPAHLVVVKHLRAGRDRARRDYGNVLDPVHGDDFGVCVGVAAVVNVPRVVALCAAHTPRDRPGRRTRRARPAALLCKRPRSIRAEPAASGPPAHETAARAACSPARQALARGRSFGGSAAPHPNWTKAAASRYCASFNPAPAARTRARPRTWVQHARRACGMDAGARHDGGVDHERPVDAEQVRRVHAARLVARLARVGQLRADGLAHVLHQELLRRDRARRKHAPRVHAALSKAQRRRPGAQRRPGAAVHAVGHARQLAAARRAGAARAGALRSAPSLSLSLNTLRLEQGPWRPVLPGEKGRAALVISARRLSPAGAGWGGTLCWLTARATQTMNSPRRASPLALESKQASELDSAGVSAR